MGKIDAILQIQRQKIRDAALRFDEGDLNLSEFIEIEFMANEAIAETRTQHIVASIQRAMASWLTMSETLGADQALFHNLGTESDAQDNRPIDHEPWRLHWSDRTVLDKLADAIKKLAPLADDGNAMIGLGEARQALENILSGDSVDVNVELSVGCRQGDADFSEGLFVCVRINEEEIRLDELNTSYSSDVGSDHFTRDYTVLTPRGGFDDFEVENWFGQLAEVLAFELTHLSVSRDHT